MATKFFAVIAGVGPGTGAAVARRFARRYPVVLLARNAASYEELAQEVNSSGGTAIGIPTDVSDGDSVRAAFQKIDTKFGHTVACAAAVFNASGKFSKKPFLDLTESDFLTPYTVSGRGAFHFSQAVLPYLLKATSQTSPHPPTLIFTGATASVKGSPLFSAFASAKFAQRGLVQSPAREFAPRGVHISHVIIDGIIDLPGTKDYLNYAGPHAKLDVDGIAETYWNLHAQPLSTITHELEVRPFVEKW